MRLCVDCKHYIPYLAAGLSFREAACLASDLVGDGRGGVECKTARLRGGCCGERARLFEAKA